MLVALLLLDFSNRVQNTRSKTQSNGRHGVEGDGSIKEDKTRKGYGELVKSTRHTVGGGGSDTHTPTRSVRNTKREESRKNHKEDDRVLVLRREVLGHVFSGPVFKEQRANQKHRDGQEVVVVHGVQVGKVKIFNALAQEEDKASVGQAVAKHPKVADVKTAEERNSLSRGFGGSLGSDGKIGPSSDNRGKDNDDKGEESERSDLTTKPNDFTVSNEDDSDILKDGEDWNGEVLHGLGRGVNH